MHCHGVGLLLLLVAVTVPGISASKGAGCGEPTSVDAPCTDPQCSRTVALGTENKTFFCVMGLPEGQPCTCNNDCYQLGNATLCQMDSEGVARCAKGDVNDEDFALGLITAGIAALFFGSNFIVVKKYETGDGLFFQWVMCVGIWFVGLAVNIMRGGPQFHALAMLGGAMWATGNVMAVTIIRCIGMGLGLALWGNVTLLTGWSSGNFGILGINQETVPHPFLNYLGLVTVVVGSVVMSQVKPTEYVPLSVNGESTDEEGAAVPGQFETSKESSSFVDDLSSLQKRILGVSLAILSGIFYGVNFNPPQYLIENRDALQAGTPIRFSGQGLDYVFSHFCGIISASTFFLVVYILLNKNKPFVYPQVILPGILSGAMWAVAQCMWFVANNNLSLVVAFPIITSMPGLVGCLWGILVFREIQGVRNLSMVAVGFCLVIGGVLVITKSKLE